MQTPKQYPLLSNCKMWRDILPALQWIPVLRIVLAPDANPRAKQLGHNYNSHGYSQNSNFPQLRSHQSDLLIIHNTWVLLISKYFYCIAAHLSEVVAWGCCLVCVFKQLGTKLWTGCSFGCSPSRNVAWNPLFICWVQKSQDKTRPWPGCPNTAVSFSLNSFKEHTCPPTPPDFDHERPPNLPVCAPMLLCLVSLRVC